MWELPILHLLHCLSPSLPFTYYFLRGHRLLIEHCLLRTARLLIEHCLYIFCLYILPLYSVLLGFLPDLALPALELS